MYAMSISPYSFKFIRNRTDKLWIELIKANCPMIKYVPEQTFDMCVTALSIDIRMIKYIKNITPEIFKYAVMKKR